MKWKKKKRRPWNRDGLEDDLGRGDCQYTRSKVGCVLARAWTRLTPPGVRQRATSTPANTVRRQPRPSTHQFPTQLSTACTRVWARSWPTRRQSSMSRPAPREGSRAARRLRRSGRVPGVLYGGGGEPVGFDADARELRHALAGAGAVLDLSFDGEKATPVVLKEAQRHPVRGETVHVDLLRVRLDEAIHAVVPLELTRRRGRAGRQGRRRARADHARAERRGAADGDPGVDRARRSARCRSARRSCSRRSLCPRA